MPKSMKKMAGKSALAAACAVVTFVTPYSWGQEQPADDGLDAASISEAEPAAEESVVDPATAPTNEPVTSASAEPETVATIPLAAPIEQPLSAPEEDTEVRRIDEIIVTATKREQSVRDIPQSITAISGEKLEDSGDLNLVDFISETPGVTATQGSSGYTRFTMRGISTDTGPTAPTPSPVGVFIGDTAFTDPYIANIVPDLSAFDLAGIQVLKGPQGTLFGGAALSGAIRYELQEPVIGQWQFRGFSQVSRPNDGSLAVTSGGAINIPVPVGENLALRIAYVKRNYPGVYDDTRSGKKDVDEGSGNQYRAILLWQPENWKIKLTHLAQDFFAPDAKYTSNSPDGPRASGVGIYEVPAKNDFGMDNLEIAYDFEAVRLTSLSSYLYKNSMFTLDASPLFVGSPPMGYPTLLGLLAPCTENSTAFSQELRLQSTGSSAFQWIAGAYYYSYKLYFNLLIDTPLNQELIGPNSQLQEFAALLGVPLDPVGDNTTFFDATSNANSIEKALFFDLSYELWDRLDLSVGARYYETNVKGGFIGNGILIRAANNGVNSDSRNEISERGINPKFTAMWHFTDDISLYGQIAKGYRFGGIQYVPSTPTNGVPPTFKSDTLWNHELGLRTSWLDRTLNADLTAFYIRYKDPIITQATPTIPINFQDNVSGAVSRGLEASLLWYTPVSGLSLSLRGALTEAYITTPFTAVGGVEIPVGQEMPGVAPEQVNASITYLRPVGNLNIGINAGFNYVGQGFADIPHSVEINGYGTFDAGIIISGDALPLHPKLAINFSNITDEIAPNAGGVGSPLVPGTPQLETYALIPSRTVTMRLSIDF